MPSNHNFCQTKVKPWFAYFSNKYPQVLLKLYHSQFCGGDQFQPINLFRFVPEYYLIFYNLKDWTYHCLLRLKVTSPLLRIPAHKLNENVRKLNLNIA